MRLPGVPKVEVKAQPPLKKEMTPLSPKKEETKEQRAAQMAAIKRRMAMGS